MHVSQAQTLYVLKSHLKTHFYNIAFNSVWELLFMCFTYVFFYVYFIFALFVLTCCLIPIMPGQHLGKHQMFFKKCFINKVDLNKVELNSRFTAFLLRKVGLDNDIQCSLRPSVPTVSCPLRAIVQIISWESQHPNMPPAHLHTIGIINLYPPSQIKQEANA